MKYDAVKDRYIGDDGQEYAASEAVMKSLAGTGSEFNKGWKESERKRDEDARAVKIDHMARLGQQRRILVAYLLAKAEAEDWHAVADAACDIREIDAKLEVLKG